MIPTESKIIGLTGGIATGKSTVTNHLRKQGYPVICADEIARAVVEPNQKAYHQIVKEFGKGILNQDHSLDRQKLATLVFKNKTLRTKLEKVIHPEVRRELQASIAALKKKKASLIFLDIPLLFEGQLDPLCDLTVCVTSFLSR